MVLHSGVQGVSGSLLLYFIIICTSVTTEEHPLSISNKTWRAAQNTIQHTQ
jgi:hypothetical protein